MRHRVSTYLLYGAVCLLASSISAKPTLPSATYSALSGVWLPPVVQGEAAPENVWLPGEPGYGEQLVPESLRSNAAISLKARHLEVLGWSPQPVAESKYRALKQNVYARLRAAHYKVYPARFAAEDKLGGEEASAGFEASRKGHVLAGLWYKKFDYLILFWGERVPQTAQRKLDDALIKTVKSGKLEEVEKLLALKADVNAHDYDGKTPLILVVGNIELMRLLLDKGANPNSRDNFGNTALLAAPDIANAKLLLNKGASPNLSNNDGYTLLISAAERGDENLARLLLEHNADPNIINKDGGTALSWAAYQGRVWRWEELGPTQYPNIVKLLLEHGANPNVGIENGWNAITLAAQDDQAGVVPMMIEASKDKNALLRATARHGQDNIVTILLEKGAAINGTSADGVTALMEAARSVEGRTVQLLLDSGADVNRRDKTGRNALMWACLPPSYTPSPDFTGLLPATFKFILARLLDKSIDLEARDQQGLSALAIAAAHGHSIAVRQLLAHGAKVNVKTPAGNTLLHEAAARYGVSDEERQRAKDVGIGDDEDYEAIAKDLIKAGVAVNARNAAGQTALTLAIAQGDQTLIKVLKAAGATQ